MKNQGQLYFGLFLTSDILLMAIILLSCFLVLAIIISMMRIYKKCGKPSISAIIPIWSQIALFQITGIAWWYIFIPIVNFVMMIKAYIILAKKFGRKSSFAIGMIFLPMIFIPLLSFYDYIGGENNKTVEEPIYNPFNETSIEPVNVLEPVAPVVPINVNDSVSVPVDENVEPIIESVDEIIEPVKEMTEQIYNDNSIIKEDAVIPVEPVGTTDYQNIEPKNTELSETVIPEIPVVNNEIIQNNEIVEENSVFNNEVVNPTVQDIQDALNINKEPSQIAFNSTPIEEPVQEALESVQNVEVKSDEEDIIELPEIAAKVCPACGVSLAENINFCTSCGTKL